MCSERNTSMHQLVLQIEASLRYIFFWHITVIKNSFDFLRFWDNSSITITKLRNSSRALVCWIWPYFHYILLHPYSLHLIRKIYLIYVCQIYIFQELFLILFVSDHFDRFWEILKVLRLPILYFLPRILFSSQNFIFFPEFYLFSFFNYFFHLRWYKPNL